MSDISEVTRDLLIRHALAGDRLRNRHADYERAIAALAVAQAELRIAEREHEALTTELSLVWPAFRTAIGDAREDDA